MRDFLPSALRGVRWRRTVAQLPGPRGGELGLKAKRVSLPCRNFSIVKENVNKETVVAIQRLGSFVHIFFRRIGEVVA